MTAAGDPAIAGGRASAAHGGTVAIAAADLVLASASPRRSALLAGIGVRFAVVPAHLDETPAPAELPHAYVTRLALAKARALAKLPDDSPVYDEVTNPIERVLMSLQGAKSGFDIRLDRQTLYNLPAVEYRYQP